MPIDRDTRSKAQRVVEEAARKAWALTDEERAMLEGKAKPSTVITTTNAPRGGVG
jgi:hypothetical protein